MPDEPFPAHGGSSEEPYGSALPGGENGSEQGLFPRPVS